MKITSNINAETKELVLNLEQTQKDEKQDIRLFDFEVEVEVIEVIEKQTPTISSKCSFSF